MRMLESTKMNGIMLKENNKFDSKMNPYLTEDPELSIQDALVIFHVKDMQGASRLTQIFMEGGLEIYVVYVARKIPTSMYLYVLGFTGPDLWTYDIFFEETISQDAARKLTCIKERIEKLRELEVLGRNE